MTPLASDEPVGALVELLRRLRRLLAVVPESVYSAEPVPDLSGSIGAHVRHCLDHVAVLASTASSPRISYDHRSRGTPDEAQCFAALARIDNLMSGVARISQLPLDTPIVVESLLHEDADPITAGSCLGRELAFVLSHTIHHFAVVALLLSQCGVAVPSRFAHAPSTLKAA